MSTPVSAPNSRILIVDDTPANIQSLAAILKEKGYQISVATNGKQALDALARVQPDLILLDVMMPEMDGFQVCAELRRQERTRDIPVILVTAKDDMETRVIGMKLGVSEFLTKPINKRELFTRVRAQIHQRTLEHGIDDILTD
jgi:putative two-component system response regulator